MSLSLEGEFFKDDFHSFGMADISPYYRIKGIFSLNFCFNSAREELVVLLNYVADADDTFVE